MKYPFYKKLVLSITAAMALCSSAVAQPYLPSSIVVVKDDLTELIMPDEVVQLLESKNISIKVYDINAVDRFEGRINKLLPGDELKARQVLEEYINRTGRAAFEREAIQAYRGLMAVVRYDLKKYPAIIFDENSVIYGVTNLEEALNRYSAWKSSESEAQ